MTEKIDQENQNHSKTKLDMLISGFWHLPGAVIGSIMFGILALICTPFIYVFNLHIERKVTAKMTMFIEENKINMSPITDCETIIKFQIKPGIDEMENPFLTKEVDRYDNITVTQEKFIQLNETSELEIIARVSGRYRSKAPETLTGKLLAKLKINGIEEGLGFEQIPADMIKPGYPFPLERQLIFKQVLKAGKYEIKVIGLYWGNLETPGMVMNYTVRKASPVQIKKYAEAEMEEAKIENNKLEEKEYAGKINLNRTQPSWMSFERPQDEIEIPGKGGSPRDVRAPRGPGNR